MASPSAPSAAPLVPAPASGGPAPADKPAKSKAELKSERRAHQEPERMSKQGKKGEAGQPPAAAKAKAPTNELQPGAETSWRSGALTQRRKSHVSCIFSGEEAPRACPGGQPRGSKEAGKETGTTAGELEPGAPPSPANALHESDQMLELNN